MHKNRFYWNKPSLQTTAHQIKYLSRIQKLLKPSKHLHTLHSTIINCHVASSVHQNVKQTMSIINVHWTDADKISLHRFQNRHNTLRKCRRLTWLFPLFELMRTSRGLEPKVFVARQNPSESRLVIFGGGRIEILSCPKEHSLVKPSLQEEWTWKEREDKPPEFLSKFKLKRYLWHKNGLHNLAN